MDEVQRPAMLASDSDRKAVAERLQTAVDEGRLGLTDYDERLRDAYAARTYAELDRVTVDLPTPAVPATPGKEIAEESWADEWKAWLGGALIMLAIWGGTSLVSGGLLPFWPAIPIGIWAAILIASALSD